jgi:HAD superfamily hydrolase (TIGR01484 family)
MCAALAARPELTLQPPDAQTNYKLSFDRTDETAQSDTAYVQTIAAQLAKIGIAAEIIVSGSSTAGFVDLLPQGIHKGAGLRHIARRLSRTNHITSPIAPATAPHIIAAGDSMNDCAMLQVADTAILPGNAQPNLVDWAHRTLSPDRLYVAEAPFAAGILEGMRSRQLI